MVYLPTSLYKFNHQCSSKYTYIYIWIRHGLGGVTLERSPAKKGEVGFVGFVFKSMQRFQASFLLGPGTLPPIIMEVNNGICNTSPYCTEKFHKKLFDFQVCILCYVNSNSSYLSSIYRHVPIP